MKLAIKFRMLAIPTQRYTAELVNPFTGNTVMIGRIDKQASGWSVTLRNGYRTDSGGRYRFRPTLREAKEVIARSVWLRATGGEA